MSASFEEEFTRICGVPADISPRGKLARELGRERQAINRYLRLHEGPKPKTPLFKLNTSGPSGDVLVKMVQGLVGEKRRTIEDLVLYASRNGGFSGAFFELLWLCEEDA